jgi:hypothetical protein
MGVMDEDLDEPGDQGGVRHKRLLLLSLSRGKLDDRGPRACLARPCLHLHRFDTVGTVAPITIHVAQGDTLESEDVWCVERKHNWFAHFEAGTDVEQVAIGVWDKKCSSGTDSFRGV